MGLSRFISSFDSFARLPKEMTEVTATGGIFTVFAFFTLIAIIVLEFNQLFVLETITAMEMDPFNEEQMEIHFNVTMLDLPCEFTRIDIIDTFGTNRLDYEGDLRKVRLHHDVYDKSVWLRGDDHLEEQLSSTDETLDFEEYASSVDDLKSIAKGVHAPDIADDHFDKMLKYFQVVFVNFYAPWCVWSKRMAGDWEETAKLIDKKRWPRRDIHVKMIRVDCEAESELCARYHIRGYPTMYLFKNGEMASEPYRDDRTSKAWIAHLETAVSEYESHLPNIFHDIGCEVSGVIRVNRCPGNFHLQAKSGAHSIAPTMANVSHVVNHLSFGSRLKDDLEERLPEKFQTSLHPLNGKGYVTEELHLSPQHYIKVVPSTYRVGVNVFGSEFAETYQLTSTNRIAKVDEDDVPQAKFKYNFSPVSIRIYHEYQTFYHFVTRFFAVLGGAYTVISLSKDGIFAVSSTVDKGRKTKILG